MRNEFLDILQKVEDPEIGYSIVDMGMIFESWAENNNAFVIMGLTAPGCPYAPQLIEDVENALKDVGYSDVNVELSEEPWTPERMTDDLKIELGIEV